MQVRLIQCGPFANESEERAALTLETKLKTLQGPGLWVLFANIEFSSFSAARPEEIDLLAIGPSGVHVIEVKHWDGKYVENRVNLYTLEDQAEILLRKSRRVAGRVKKNWPGVNFIQGKFLLTKGDSVSYTSLSQMRGASFFSLRDWQTLLDTPNQSFLNEKQVDELACSLKPAARIALNGDIKHFGHYSKLELQSDRNDRFHRIYRGVNERTQDKVILHVYDYSASDAANCDQDARREYETIQRLQKAPCLPRLMESFQEAPEFPGELFYFSLVDPGAPTIEKRSKDSNWKSEDRVRFASDCFTALSELHSPADPDEKKILHRNLNSSTIHVRSNGKPLFSGLRFARVAELGTLALDRNIFAEREDVAPEVRIGGLSSTTESSDVYSLCHALSSIFNDDNVSAKALTCLNNGLSEKPSDRPSADTLSKDLAEIAQRLNQTTSALPAAKYWDEGTEVEFGQSRYRVIAKLGSGGWGTTFKVVELDLVSGEEYGTYVAKAVHSELEGNTAIRAHKKIRSHTTHPSMSQIFQIADKWRPDSFVSLLKWIDGIPLSGITGQLGAVLADSGENTAEELFAKWLIHLCEGLTVLHEAGYAHCDISPKNLIVSGSKIFMTDYDLATRIGTKAISKGTLEFCSPAMQSESAVSAVDDLFALASSVFKVLFDRMPFGEGLNKLEGLNWTEENKSQFPILFEFLERCVSAEDRKKFSTAAEASQFLQTKIGSSESVSAVAEPPTNSPRTPNEIPWLTEILKAYPKSRFGNAETRGLDSDFAKMTYVETDLERNLLSGIANREVKLVILTGNAGDGKTAFLQHLASSLGLSVESSSTRVIDQTLKDGLTVRINLDGSASYQGRTATALLDDLFEPFHKGGVPSHAVHLVAINSGPLMAWVEDYESRHPGEISALSGALYQSIEGDFEDLPKWLRFIDFNERSLVGGINDSAGTISTTFVDQLVDAMLGGLKADQIWSPCLTCTAFARCPIANTVSQVRGKGFYSVADATRMRERLYDALQAVHQRAEVHITARDLRGALSYIIFGLHNCKDVHTESMHEYSPFWDRAFSAESPRRQGEVLMELCTLDPALESHPNIDRFLLGLERTDDNSTISRYPQLTLSSARRRAYFDWPDSEIAKFGDSSSTFGIRRATHFQQFKRFPLLPESERERICREVCIGLSRLVDLPDVVLNQPNQVPLRVTPRTPTETVFWVNKPISRFTLLSPLTEHTEDMESLHTHLLLQYQYERGISEDLYLSADLFSILMELKDGYQFVDAALDDTFANLSIFIGRLAQENQTELFAWNPANENKTYQLTTVLEGNKRCLQLN